MLILTGSFSLLAASTRCRRTSITASLCLLVSMASHSDTAVDDLMRMISQGEFRPEVELNLLSLIMLAGEMRVAGHVCSEWTKVLAKHKETIQAWLNVCLTDTDPGGWEEEIPDRTARMKVKISIGNIWNVSSLCVNILQKGLVMFLHQS